MTRFINISGLTLTQIEVEKSRVCQKCGKVAETRPYGEGGMRICYPCGMKNIRETERQFSARMNGELT